MKNKLMIAVSLMFVMMAMPMMAKENWPRKITLDDGTKVTLYQPQPESLNGNILSSRSVLSVKMTDYEEPVFGVVWTEASLLTDTETRMAKLVSFKVTDAKIPDVTDQVEINKLCNLIETEVPTWNLVMSIDEIVATIEQDHDGSSDEFNTDAPKIIYRDAPATLVVLDGAPIIKNDEDLNMERVVNTPFMIVKSRDDNKFYLYASGNWYRSATIENGWQYVTVLPYSIRSLDSELRKQEKEDRTEGGAESVSNGTPVDIIISTSPAELIQTDGEAEFASVDGTNLLYISNTPDYIFRNITDHMYYVLLSGRWYTAYTLKGPWSYVASDKLPEDFALIPEGTDQDAVLAHVAGTYAAREAVMNAQIPQTARVDRYSATCNVYYDGEPSFEKIDGTDMYVAVNSSVTVIYTNNRYYAVENGVWFISDHATGPWFVSTERPQDIDRVPPTSIAYHTRYVYIYEVTVDYIYMGYTPGYLNCYVYGPTVIYGTGYYYHPWYGVVYYPRPVTWGYGMHYNPWYGWGMSYHYRHCCHHHYYDPWFYGGWWGPPVYYPPYYPPYEPGHGNYYGHRSGYNDQVNIDHSNNIYTHRKDVVSTDLGKPVKSRGYRDISPVKPGTSGEKSRSEVNPVKPGSGDKTRTTDNQVYGEMKRNTGTTTTPGSGEKTRTSGTGDKTRVISPKQSTDKIPNNVYSDKTGNVYKKEPSGNWQQRDEGKWKPAEKEHKPATQQLERSVQMRERSEPKVKESSAGSSKSSSYDKSNKK